MTLNEFLLEYGRHPLGGGFTSGFREHLDAAVAERVEAAVVRERERCAKVLDALAEEYEDRSRRAELRTWADSNWAEARVVRGCARAIREADDE